jgi:hypothetical protein
MTATNDNVRKATRYFGVIDETEFSLRFPRPCNEGGYETLPEAMAEAAEMIACGVERVSIVRCVYVDASDCWYEVDEGSIALDASNCDSWFNEEG